MGVDSRNHPFTPGLPPGRFRFHRRASQHAAHSGRLVTAPLPVARSGEQSSLNPAICPPRQPLVSRINPGRDPLWRGRTPVAVGLGVESEVGDAAREVRKARIHVCPERRRVHRACSLQNPLPVPADDVTEVKVFLDGPATSASSATFISALLETS